ncbi:hypothetical protein ROA7745_03866 [Roseovarius aestuarii]|uniref:Peptidase C-terminal archaeal/bacterial domain-containing protein n=2 Tax=Roseovarius aestuarii TaxID=475083 RepID=A0A1X7BWM7_9RHOB|nr:hypothetical protein ROA7745_03866 [Roseovarius aestuarii]
MLMRNSTIAAMMLTATGFGSVVNARSWDPGPYPEGFVSANGNEVYYEVFEGGYLAEIELDGDCRSDIDLWIYDDNGHLITKSTSYDCYEYVNFVPAWTGEFKIVVENHGKPNGSRYWLTTY